MARALFRPKLVFLALTLVFLAIFPYLYKLPVFSIFFTSFRNFQATRFAIWLIILMGLNLLTGYSGQISLGHAAFVAVGAYIAAIAMNDWGAPIFLAVLIAALLTGFIGFLIGIPALRLSGPYLAIATLALIIVLPQVLKHPLIDQWTGGVNGIRISFPVVPTRITSNVNLNMNVDQWLYYNCMAAAVIMTAMAWSLTRSRFGRAFVALRDSEIGAQQMGINIALYKMTAFGVSSLYAGVGGALYVYQAAYLGPTSFDILFSLLLLVMIVLGGLASITGTIFAALLLTFRVDITDFFINHIPYGSKVGIDPLRGAVFGILLIITVIFTPMGIAGNIRKLRNSNIGGKFAGLFKKSETLPQQKEAETSSD